MKKVFLLSLLSTAVLLGTTHSLIVAQTTPEGTPTAPAETPATPAEPAAPAAPAAPEAESATVVAVASSSDSFKTLTAAIKAAGLESTLTGSGPFTVFAPTDEAFAALPPGTLETLLKPENKDKLVQILTYHVVAEELPASGLKSGEVKTVQGSSIQVKVDGETVTVDEAKVVQADIEASNGVIHAIDQVILPST